jgi:GMP synthase-like glutamine amidotransferase
MGHPIRLTLGLLRTDTVLEEFQPRFGDYPDMFGSLLDRAAQAFPGLSLELPGYFVPGGELPASPEECDGYVITGSRYSVYDDEPWITSLAAFLAGAVAARRKVAGICFGHQLIAHFFGGRTEPAPAGWAVGVHGVRLLSRETWMVPERARVGLLSSHKDQVSRLPDGARLIASTDSCPLAGFVIGEDVMTLQGHPEFSKSYAEALMRKREGLLGPEKFAAGIESLGQETDEPLVGQWLLRFFLGDRVPAMGGEGTGSTRSGSG